MGVFDWSAGLMSAGLMEWRFGVEFTNKGLLKLYYL